MTPAELAAFAPGFDWNAYLAGADLPDAQRVVVNEKDAFPAIAAIFAATPVKTLQAWEAFNVADSAAPFLSQPFVDANFEFRAKTLSGQQEQRPRWKRAVGLINRDMGFAVGRLYVAQYFPPESRAKMLALVGNIREALAARIQRVDWMSDATKARALQKLSMLNVKIGYPTKWRDYSALSVAGDDLVGDVRRASALRVAPPRQPARQAGRQDRVGHDAADRERLLQPDPQRDRLPGRHPAAAVLRPGMPTWRSTTAASAASSATR